MLWIFKLFLILLTWAGFLTAFTIVSTNYLQNHTSNTEFVKTVYYLCIGFIAFGILYFTGNQKNLISNEPHEPDLDFLPIFSQIEI